MSTGPAVPMEWKQFVALIADVDRTLEHVIYPDDPWLKQEAIQQMAMSLSQGYHAILAQDLRVPAFFSFLNPVIKSAAPNPDYMYRTSFVEGRGTYRLSGQRNTSLFVHVGIGSGYIGVDDQPGPSLGHIDLDTITRPDGTFSIILSPERPSGRAAMRATGISSIRGRGPSASARRATTGRPRSIAASPSSGSTISPASPARRRRRSLIGWSGWRAFRSATPSCSCIL